MNNILDDFLAASFLVLPEREREAGRKSLLWLCSSADYQAIQSELTRRAGVFGTIQVYYGIPAASPSTLVIRGYHITMVDAGFVSTGICAMPALTVPTRNPT